MKISAKTGGEISMVTCSSQKVWEAWLAKNQGQTDGVWLRFFKKASGTPSVNYKQAVDGALCFGWIDGQSDSYDDQSWIQKFTPRRARSIWSKKNIENVERLIKAGKMRPAGLRAIEAAKADGRWARAYDSSSTMKMPEDFLEALSKHKKAKAFFDTLNKANTYAIAWRLQTAKKPETRQRRMEVILQMLKDGKKLH